MQGRRAHAEAISNINNRICRALHTGRRNIKRPYSAQSWAIAAVCLAALASAAAVFAQSPALNKEYIYLGGKLIAIEQAGGQHPSGPPTITGFSPSIGTAGTQVTVNGTNFETVPAFNTVKFNVTTAAVSTATSTTMNTAVPSGATSGRISLTTSMGQATSSDDFFVPTAPYTAGDVAFTGRVALGGNINVTLANPNKIGLVVFDGTVGQRISVTTSAGTFPSCGADITVYSPAGTSIGTACIGATGFIDVPAALPANGTYTILIDPRSTNTGSVNLTINTFSDASASLVLGTPSTITLTQPGQNAYLTFSGTRGQRVSLQASNVTIANSTISIYNPSLGPLTAGQKYGVTMEYYDGGAQQ